MSEKEINPSTIKVLLRVVNLSLMVGYETENLEGKSLMSIYMEYLDTVEKRKKIPPWYVIFFRVFITTIFASVTINTYIIDNTFETIQIVCTIITVVLTAVFISKLIINPPLNREWKYNRIIDECEEIFREFEESVKKLDSQGMIIHHAYTNSFTESSIHNTLVASAARLLDEEKKFRAIRLNVDQPTCSVLEAGNREVKCRMEFEEKMEAANKFGLRPSKKELFAEASTKR